MATIAEKPGASEAWKRAARVDDVEFVDCFLHIQERIYDVPGLFKCIAQGGLSFLRWMDPPAWEAGVAQVGDEIAERAKSLGAMQSGRLVENLGLAPNAMELYLCHSENSLRPMPGLKELASAVYAVHPEIRFHTMQRNIWCATRMESLAVERRTGDPVPVPHGPLRSLAMVLRDQNEPFQGQSMFDVLAEEGFAPEAVAPALLHAIQQEWVYCPHDADLV